MASRPICDAHIDIYTSDADSDGEASGFHIRMLPPHRMIRMRSNRRPSPKCLRRCTLFADEQSMPISSDDYSCISGPRFSPGGDYWSGLAPRFRNGKNGGPISYLRLEKFELYNARTMDLQSQRPNCRQAGILLGRRAAHRLNAQFIFRNYCVISNRRRPLRPPPKKRTASNTEGRDLYASVDTGNSSLPRKQETPNHAISPTPRRPEIE